MSGQLGLWGIGLFLAVCFIEGCYRGLQDHFGTNILEGYRQYRREKAFWDAVNADSRNAADKTLAQDR